MATFLVEAYTHAADRHARLELAARARAAAADLAGEGTAVRHLRTIVVPEDETSFHLFQAPSAEAVRAVVERAELGWTRITEAVT